MALGVYPFLFPNLLGRFQGRPVTQVELLSWSLLFLRGREGGCCLPMEVLCWVLLSQKGCTKQQVCEELGYQLPKQNEPISSLLHLYEREGCPRGKVRGTWHNSSSVSRCVTFTSWVLTVCSIGLLGNSSLSFSTRCTSFYPCIVSYHFQQHFYRCYSYNDHFSPLKRLLVSPIFRGSERKFVSQGCCVCVWGVRIPDFY